MKKMKKLLAGMTVSAALLASTSQISFAGMSSDQRLNDFNQMVNLIERNYGPLRWKQTSIGLDWNRLVSEYKEKVLKVKSDTEFYTVLAKFTSSLKDGHVSAMVPSTRRARLGFLCDLVDGKVLIETIDTLKLPELLFPFKKGDQLLAIGGVPVDALLDEFEAINDTGHKASSRRIAAARLTSRSQATGMQIPRGVTTVTVLKKGAAEPVTVTATWIVTGTPVLELDNLDALLTEAVSSAVSTAFDGESLKAELNKMSEFQMALPKLQLEEWAKAGVNDIGSTTSMFKLPEGAKELNGLPVTAAIYEAAGKKIGILRIPSYGDQGLLNVVARAISTMEKETDVLVLDQTNNPGGSVSLVSDIISLFADKSYKDMDFEVRPSLGWVTAFQEVNTKIADMLAKNPKDQAANALKARFEFLEEEIRDSITNKKFLTSPISLNLNGSFGMIQPSGSVRYTKPVLLLINEFDFSGGDAFPALMKDNGRVTLFGQQTSGAGGNVREYGPLANSFFKFSLTESLMVRPNGEYMENRGVVPDVSYTVTEDDFMNGYRGYVKAFTVEALKLAGASDVEIKDYVDGKPAAAENNGLTDKILNKLRLN
ncbi:MAG: protease-like activity factor CPAF [Oligoflexia bacterium]|nr:protease-like activity factor CPAF [Oligoflexia bacterium]